MPMRIENQAFNVELAAPAAGVTAPVSDPESAVALASSQPESSSTSVRAAASNAVAATPSSPQLGALSVGLLALADPMSMLLAIASSERARGERVNTDQARSAGQTAEAAATQRQEAAEKAQKAARKAGGFLKFAPKWVTKLVGAVLAAVAVVGAAFTGGATLALAIVAVSLLAAGDMVEAAISQGWIKPGKAQWVALGLQVAGAVLMSVSGIGAAELGETAGTLARVADMTGKVATFVQDVNEIKNAAMQAGAAVFEFKSARFQRHAESAGIVVDAALQEQDSASESLRAGFQSYARVAQRVQRMQSIRQQAAMAQARSLA